NPISKFRPEWNEAAFQMVMFKHGGGDVTSLEFRTLVETMWRLDLLVRWDEHLPSDFKQNWSNVSFISSTNKWGTVIFNIG
ncbi:hypothetical protein K7W42_15745, partial [Deinococcus sp. HMF7604]|uniref:hypothetical protein n=1 Tax=Deinococcus betulae TaxID=2873312 RepID=UPI001CCEB2BB